VLSDLAGLVDGIPERFVPQLMHGEPVEAEHLCRYWWASGLVAGKAVLDAGCGVGYGSNILAEAGAREVFAVDAAKAVVEVARRAAHSAVHVEQADVRNLPLDDGSCDVVVCFEVIEHLDAPEKALDEFARVLDEQGVLAISSPNRQVYVPGNPHHRHEFVPEELSGALAERFGHVRLYRQTDWLTSAVMDDDSYTSKGVAPLRAIEVRKAVGQELGTELYTLALAGNAALPELPASAVLTHVTQFREWAERLQSQDAALIEKGAQLDSARRELHEARERLAEAEALLARAGSLEQELEEQRYAAVRAREAMEAMQATRVWRAGVRYWRIRDRVLRRG
jgi:SAM-dependent methyltransferase